MGKRVLLVDDSPMLRHAVRSLFEAAEFVCYEAEDGAKAVEQAAIVQPDLIVLDLAMPKMNGLQAAPILRHPLPSVPIILLTLYAGTVVEKEATAAGITSIVSKDVAGTSLLARAEALLQS